MKITVDKTELIKVLQRVQGIVEKRNTLPILSNVLIEGANGGITIMATDLEIFIKDICPADVDEKGAITVNARKLFEIVRSLPEERVDINIAEDKMGIVSGKVKYNIMGIPAKEFPAFPSVPEDSLARIDQKLLSDMIDKTAFAVSTDETRYNINGFFLQKEDSRIRMVTTDGHRLALIEKDYDSIPVDTEGVILPRKGVVELRKLFEEEGSFFFGISEKNATVKKDTTIMNIRLIEGEFPDYKQVIPKENDKRVVADRTELLEALKRVSILASDRIKGVKFSFSTGRLVLSSSNPDIGDVVDELDVEYQGQELEVAFNARYFIDVFSVMEEDRVVMEFKDSVSPGVVKPEGSEDYLYIVMPMRL